MKLPLIGQISEVRREIEQRQRVYPRLVAQRKLKSGEADYRIANMEAVLGTLVWLAAHEETVREAVANKGGAQ